MQKKTSPFHKIAIAGFALISAITFTSLPTQQAEAHQNGKQFKRTGIVVLIMIKDWGEGEILRHEATMPFSVDERLHLLKETELMASPTHGLYSDPRGLLDEVILESGRKQVVSFQTDHTREEVFVIESPKTIEKIQHSK